MEPSHAILVHATDCKHRAYSKKVKDPDNFLPVIGFLIAWRSCGSRRLLGTEPVTLSQQFSYQFAVIAIVCTIALFLFPVARGSYSAVHGPVTALRSMRTKFLTWVAVTWHALCRLSGPALRNPSLALDQAQTVTARSSLDEYTTILRC